MSWFDNLKKWAEMTVQQRLSVLIGVIIVVLSLVIIHYENKVTKLNEDHRSTVRSIVTRYTAREAALEAKIDICNQNYLRYVTESEQEYRDLLFQAKKLDEKLEKIKDDEDIK